MSAERTIRACKSAITDFAYWLNTGVWPLLKQKVLWLKEIFIVKNDNFNDRAATQHENIFEPVGNLQCCVENGFGHNNTQVLTVKIKGKIKTNSKGTLVNLRVIFEEFVETNQKYEPVYQKIENNGCAKQVHFDYICELGKVNEEEKEFSDWISVAKIKPQWILFARKGHRRIRATIELFNKDNSDIYCKCQTFCECYNRQWGYLDITENTERARALAVTLAFALSAADARMYKCEIKKINEWALSTYQADKDIKDRRELTKALKKTVRFFKKGNRINLQAVCKELLQITETWQRYDILSFCLNVVESKGFISAGQINILKDLSKCFDIDQEHFRSLMERLAPVDTHEFKDPELIMGLSSDLNSEQKREVLNNEYRKWNSRVTNVDPKIRSQAQQMLELITETRSKCVR